MSLSIGCELLYKILLQKDRLEFSKLSKDMFEQHEVKMFEFISNHVVKYGNLPEVNTFSNKFKLEIEDSMEEPLSYYKDTLLNRYIGNIVSSNLNAINANIDNDNKKVIDIFRNIVSKVDSNLIASESDIVRVEVVGRKVYQDILRKRVLGGITGVPTGWATLDEATSGFEGGDIIVVLARPKKGKTIVMLCAADAAYTAGYNPMLISMEMSELQIGARIFAKRASLNMTDVYRGQLSHWGEQRLLQTISSMEETNTHKYIYVEGQFQRDINNITAAIAYYKPDIVFLDGGYLVKSKEWNNLQRWDKVANIIERLKTTAIHHNIPIVVSFQFSRQVSRKTKSIKEDAFEGIQLSDAISQIATTGIAILDDEYEQERVKVIEVIGGRNDEKGRFRINWLWDTMNFSEIRDESPVYEDAIGEVTLQWE